ELGALGDFAVSEVNALVRAVPAKSRIRDRGEQLVGVAIVRASPELQLCAIGVDTVLHVDALSSTNKQREQNAFWKRTLPVLETRCWAPELNLVNHEMVQSIWSGAPGVVDSQLSITTGAPSAALDAEMQPLKPAAVTARRKFVNSSRIQSE